MTEAQQTHQSRKIFVANLSPATNSIALAQYFRKFGEVTGGHISFEKRNGYVTFSNVNSLEKCLQSRPHTIDNVEVDVKLSAMQVVVGNFDVHVLFPDKFKIDREATVKHFSKFGGVYDCIIPFDGNGEPKRYCVIKFHNGESSIKAIEDRKQKIGETDIVVSKLLHNGKLDQHSFDKCAPGDESNFRNTSISFGNIPESSRALQGPARNSYDHMPVLKQSYMQTSRNSSAPYRKGATIRRDQVFYGNYPAQRGHGSPPFPIGITHQSRNNRVKINSRPARYVHRNRTYPTTIPQQHVKDEVKKEHGYERFDGGSCRVDCTEVIVKKESGNN